MSSTASIHDFESHDVNPARLDAGSNEHEHTYIRTYATSYSKIFEQIDMSNTGHVHTVVYCMGSSLLSFLYTGQLKLLSDW